MGAFPLISLLFLFVAVLPQESGALRTKRWHTFEAYPYLDDYSSSSSGEDSSSEEDDYSDEYDDEYSDEYDDEYSDEDSSPQGRGIIDDIQGMIKNAMDTGKGYIDKAINAVGR